MKDVREVARAGPAPARRARPGHDPVPRRGPPLQQVPAGRAAARRGERPLTLIGATTENPFFEVNPPLLLAARRCSASSRSTSTRRGALIRARARGRGGHGRRRRRRPPRGHANGDGRHVLTTSRWRWRSPAPGRRPSVVTLADAEAALGTKALRYGRDEHYDVITAFIKSIRGSDPDAGLYWLARMLEAGEDARFIARRLVILASEDIGDGRPAGAARRRRRRPRRRVRRPARGPAQPGPGRRPPGHGAQVEPGRHGHLDAREDVRHGPSVEVPVHLRDAHYQERRSSGTARATTILTTTRRAGSAASTSPTRSEAAATTSRRPRLRAGDPRAHRQRTTSGAGPRRDVRTELAAAIVAVASVVGVVAAGRRPRRRLAATLRAVRESGELLRRETVPVMAELGGTVRTANAELERADDLLGTAE